MNGLDPRPGPSRKAGLAALGKCVLLLVGLPAAVARLWLVAPVAGGHGGTVGLALHVLLVAVALGWLLAALRLIGDLVRALRGAPPAGVSWSWRWAAALAGLLLAASATTRAVGSAPSSTTTSTPAAAVAVAPHDPPGTPRAVDAAPASPRAVDVAPAELAGVVALVGLGLLGGSALARRTRLLRRLGECFRSPGERLLEPDEATAWTEALLGPLGDADVIDWIEAANRLLWRALRDEGWGRPGAPPLPEIRLVRASLEGVELLLAEPIEPAPDGFVALDGGARWLLDPRLDLDQLEALTAGSGRSMAALVPVGDDGQACFLVPVGPDRRLALFGKPAHRAPVMAYLLVALRTLPWAEELAVELVGCGMPEAEEHCYQLNASSYAELAAVGRRPAAAEDRLAATWCRTPLVVVGEAPTTTEQEEILQRLSGRAGVISLGGSGTERLVLDDKGAYLEPLGIELDPPRPTPGQLAAVEALLLAAGEPAVVPSRAEVPAGPAGRSAADPSAAAGRRPSDDDRPSRGRQARRSAPPPAGPVEVRLLDGRPRVEDVEGVEGATASRDAGRATEVVAFLALHGHEATMDQLRSSVFRRADRLASPSRVQNVCSVARRMLGQAPDGRAYLSTLPTVSDGRYRLDPAVTCDWARFSVLVDAARELPGREAAVSLETALRLVGERPLVCAPANSWHWFAAEGLARALVSGIVDAAHHLASLALAAGDAEVARLAIAKGRLLEPASELLVRDLLAACELDGDREGLEAVYQELESTLEGLGGHEPSAVTRALYESLTTQPRAVGA